MFEINIDENGYYAAGDGGTAVSVEAIPDADARTLPAYRYDESAQSLVLDEDRLAEIQAGLEEGYSPSKSERLDAVEDAVAELAALMGGE